MQISPFYCFRLPSVLAENLGHTALIRFGSRQSVRYRQSPIFVPSNDGMLPLVFEGTDP